MKTDKRKIVIVGTGMVGMSYAYCLLNQSVCDELVLIDVDKKRAEGEAMDLNHGLAFAGSSMKIYAGDYESCQDADLVLIAAGVAQKQGETRLDLLKRNTQVFRSIIEPVTASGFNGIFLVATNPVDIMTRITCALSGFNPRRVLGSGTALDTARLRYLLGEYLGVDPRNIHAYVMGEHGDSEFVPWSQAFLATKSISQLDWELESSLTAHLLRIEEEVRTAAYKIIEAKKSTYYGIGMALTRITKAILGEEVVFTFDEVRISADELLVRIIRHALFELHEALVRAHEDVFAVVPRNNADRRINRGGIQRIHFELIDNLELRIQEENIVFRTNNVFSVNEGQTIQRLTNSDLFL